MGAYLCQGLSLGMEVGGVALSLNFDAFGWVFFRDIQ